MTRTEDEIRDEATINGAETVQPRADDPRQRATPEQAAAYMQQIQTVMPGLTGGIDLTLKKEMGQPIAFVVFTFGPGGAAYSTNISSQEIMRSAIRDIVVGWGMEPEKTEPVLGDPRGS